MRIATVAGCLAFAAAYVGCTLLVDQDATQCAADGDCARFVGTRCAQGGCVPIDAAIDTAIDPASPCTSTQDCLALRGSNWVCRKSSCQPLGSDDCGIVIGNYTADDVLLLGAILPIYGAHKSTGLPIERVLAFATDQDFREGVPFGEAIGDAGRARRPVAVVLCDESRDPVRAAKHLANDVKVPAILGPAFGGAVRAVAEQVTIAKGVLLVSPYATADLSLLAADAGTQGLMWRTAPDAHGEAMAMVDVVAGVLEPRIDSERSTTTIAVAVVSGDDADDASLRALLVSSLRFNGAPATAASNAGLFTNLSYGDPDAPGADRAGLAVSTLLGASPLPAVVAVLGETQAVGEVIQGIEDGLAPLSVRRPYYVLSHGLQVAELLALVRSRPDLRKRILVFAPGDNERNNPALRELLFRYRQLYTDYPAQTFGVPQTFDAYYLLAYGLSAVRNVDVVGRDVDDGLNKILAGAGAQPVAVGREGIPAAFAAIGAGQPIALQGASGALQFDRATGTPASDVQVSCITQSDPASPAVFTAADLSWSATTGSLAGTLSTTCLQ